MELHNIIEGNNIRFGEIVYISPKPLQTAQLDEFKHLLRFKLNGIGYSFRHIYGIDNAIIFRRIVISVPHSKAYVAILSPQLYYPGDIVDIIAEQLRDIITIPSVDCEIVRPQIPKFPHLGFISELPNPGSKSVNESQCDFYCKDAENISEGNDFYQLPDDGCLHEDKSCNFTEDQCPIPDDAFSLSIEDDEYQIINDRQRLLIEKLRNLILEYVANFHTMPPIPKIAGEIMHGNLTLASSIPSPIVVNGDMRIILSGWDNTELRMTPLARTVYILFLMHPEGIALRCIGDYRKQLSEIYSLVKPGAAKAEAIIEDLAVPSGDSLRQKISMIRRAIDNTILDPRMAERYYISGRRSLPYSIAGISPDLITLPEALNL